MPDAPLFDLQSHSIHSDGQLPPADVVRHAAESGVELMALSDHDTIDGVDEALAAGEEHGVRVVPASELSAVYESWEDLHVLGYGIDHTDPKLLELLDSFREDRELRAERMADRLRELGWHVDTAPLEPRRREGKPIGRPHLAAAVFNDPANAPRLAEERLGDFSALLEAYLIPGKPAYLPRTRPTVEQAIEIIHAAGGVAVWAHPFWDLSDNDEVLANIHLFREWGLDGVEVFYPSHSRAQAHLLHDHCAADGMLMTGSSDFHGPAHRLFSSFRAFELHGLAPELGPLG